MKIYIVILLKIIWCNFVVKELQEVFLTRIHRDTCTYTGLRLDLKRIPMNSTETTYKELQPKAKQDGLFQCLTLVYQ